MSERISELIKQVGTDVSGKWVGIDNIEKFAKLIVRECAGLCSNPVVVLQHWGIDSDAESVL